MSSTWNYSMNLIIKLTPWLPELNAKACKMEKEKQ